MFKPLCCAQCEYNSYELMSFITMATIQHRFSFCTLQKGENSASYKDWLILNTKQRHKKVLLHSFHKHKS